MNEYDLFEAFGGVDEDLLERSEAKTPRRLSLRKPLIAAAAVILLAVTVFAVPAIRELLFHTDMTMVTEGGRHIYGDLYVDIDDDVYRIDLKLEKADGLPTSIEEVRLPGYMLENDWLVRYGEIDAVNSDSPVRFSWWDRNSPKWVTFEQKCIPTDGAFPGEGCFELQTYHGAEMKQETIRYSAAEIICYSIPAYRNEDTWEAYSRETAVYWSDGSYVYHLRCSRDVTPEDIAKIVLSVGPVRDVTPYLKNDPENDAIELVSPPLDVFKMPTAIPEGYTLKVCADNGWHINWIWEDADGHTITLTESHSTIETELMIHEMIQKNSSNSAYTREEFQRDDTTYYIFANNRSFNILWEEGPRCSSDQAVNFFGHVYDFHFDCGGSMSRTEMLAVINSMTAVEDLTPYLTQ